MKKSEPDLSNQNVSLGLLITIFPQLGSLKWIFGDKPAAYTRSTAILGVAVQLGKAFAAACFFVFAILLSIKITPYFSGIDIVKSLTKLIAAFVGLPAMMVIVLSLDRSFDLFYLWMTGKVFEKADSGLESMKVIMLAAGFVGSLFLAGITLYYLEIHHSKVQNAKQLRAEQKEFFTYLDKGRAAWNEYITSSPKHNIDFGNADLSKRNFKGFFFSFVRFEGADLTDTVFDDCYLGYTGLNEAKCHRTSFKGSYLVGADFVNTDMTGVDLSGAFGKREDFKKAKIPDNELKKLQDPAKSRWHEVSWADFRSDEWLRQKGWWSQHGKPKGLQF